MGKNKTIDAFFKKRNFENFKANNATSNPIGADHSSMKNCAPNVETTILENHPNILDNPTKAP